MSQLGFEGVIEYSVLELMTAWIVILWSCVLLVVHAKLKRAEMLNSRTSVLSPGLLGHNLARSASYEISFLGSQNQFSM